jgi:acetyl-CoA carboxylase biotin carboxylase subunit
VQVVADQHGNVAAVGERECSIQRRHQKLVEEAPAITLDEPTRADLLARSARAIAEVGYSNVGTLEFLLDEDAATGEGRFYFMEMNTRIQVEHTVTEMVTGLDLVREQIRLAAGEPLSASFMLQGPPGGDSRAGRFRPRGHAIECRINAEDPRTFAPSPGRITGLNLPGGLGVRVDTHIYDGYVVPPNYDSLLAKLIVHAEDRESARRRLRRALQEFVIEGIKSNLDFHRRLVDHPDFIAGRIDTHFLERFASSDGDRQQNA